MAAPRWLLEILRAQPVAPPWLRMVRTALAVTGPLALGYALGNLVLGLPAALGGLISSVVERGGPYLGRIKLVGGAVAFGGTAGMGIGLYIHGKGWVVVWVVTLLALVSALLSAAGSIGSVAGLQLLLYTVLGSGPLALVGPWWLVIGLFLLGAAWALGLSVLGWTLSPRRPETLSVAEAYRAVARMLRAIGTEDAQGTRQAVTTALNTAYDEVLTARAAIAGSDPQHARLAMLLNETHKLVEAAVTLAQEGGRPWPLIRGIDAVADSIRNPALGVPPIPRPHGGTPGLQALWEALVSVTEVLRGRSSDAALPRTSGRDRLHEYLAEVRHGRLLRQFAMRLMLCMAVAAVVSEVLPLQRSYWVMLTVIVVLKPDFGSVFARALQRGGGTVVGAVIGAVLLAIVPYGLPLLIVVAVLTFLLPYAFSRNFGLFATLLTPLVVVLIDLFTHAGWQLAEVRLIDTLVGCGIVLVLGYAPWPSSWHAQVGPQFADAVAETSRYLRRAFCADPAGRSVLRRQVYRRLSDLRTVFQRALSEPAAISRRATAWYPAVVGLERTLDAITATVVTAERGGVAPSAAAVRKLADALDEINYAVRTGGQPRRRPLPTESIMLPVARRISDVFELFRRSEVLPTA